MTTMTQIDQNRKLSLEKTKKIIEKVKNISELKKIDGDYCIYVTGSFGRLEASKHSDLDLFFIYLHDEIQKIPKISEILINAELIKISRNLNFPEFSGDGRFLEVHNKTELIKNIGSPEDDYKNYFTARMLLLLESKAIHNPSAYQKTINDVIEAYFKDYHDHEKSFRPIFIANDILRFWRTLCLNYEHNRTFSVDSERQKRKAHLKNLKLKFSRLLTCFSAIIPMFKKPAPYKPEDLELLIKKSPLERLEGVKSDKKSEKLVNNIFEKYNWFLEQMNRSKDFLLEWIGDKDHKSERDLAFAKGREFQNEMYELLDYTADPKLKKFLVI